MRVSGSMERYKEVKSIRILDVYVCVLLTLEKM